MILHKPQKLKVGLEGGIVCLPQSNEALKKFLELVPLAMLQGSPVKTRNFLDMDNNADKEYLETVKRLISDPTGNNADEYIDTWLHTSTKAYSELYFSVQEKWLQHSEITRSLKKLLMMTYLNKTTTSERDQDPPITGITLLKGKQGSGFPMHTEWTDAANYLAEFNEDVCTTTPYLQPLAEW